MEPCPDFEKASFEVSKLCKGVREDVEKQERDDMRLEYLNGGEVLAVRLKDILSA